MGRYRSEYLFKNYGLTEYDYYLIVVCDGLESNLPKCEYPGCCNFKKFNTLGITKKIPILARGCCKKHSVYLRAKAIYEQNKSNGIILSCKGMKRSEKTRELNRRSALNQVKLGTHPWLRENSIEARRRTIEEGKNYFVNMWSARDQLKKFPDLDIYDPKKMNDIEYVLVSERDSYKYRGDLSDICQFYVTYLEGNSKVFKIGVTKNINRRIKNQYHSYKYKDSQVLFTGTREVVSDLEYVVKKKFIKKVVLGTETFSISDYDEILEFIRYQIKLIG